MQVNNLFDSNTKVAEIFRVKCLHFYCLQNRRRANSFRRERLRPTKTFPK
jgi:hypothetical protein